MSTRSRIRLRGRTLVAFTAILALGALALPTPGQATAPPSLRLIAASSEHTAISYKGQPIPLALGIYVGSPEGDFELRATRPDYDTPMSLTRWVDGIETETLDASLLTPGLRGLDAFLHYEIRNKDGGIVVETDTAFCPATSGRQRLSDDSEIMPRYPVTGCWAMPFTKGTVWGIDRNWAAVAVDEYGATEDAFVELRKGRYTVEVSVNEPYRTLFGFPSGADSATVKLKVEETDCYDYGYGYSTACERARAEP
ncbi:MAG: hypothetical protein WD670_05190, partial [Actinomycetota bacterium]